jgi:hypothetical protein
MISKHYQRNPKSSALNTTEDVAASLLRQFLIDPFSENRGPELSRLSEDEKSVLEVLATQLGTSVNGLIDSPLFAQKAIERLSKFMREKVLTESRTKTAKESLGIEGLLSPSEYAIEFGDLVKVFVKFGERPSNIESVIHYPDVTEHLRLPGLINAEKKESLSFFVREITPTKRNRFLQMVIARRIGSKLIFCAAWRFYREIFSWDDSMSPVDLFRKFVERYGVPFSIEDGAPTKFILEEVRDIAEGANRSIRLRVDTSKLQSEKHFFTQLTIVNDINPKRQFLSIGYAIDSMLYTADMEKYGKGPIAD